MTSRKPARQPSATPKLDFDENSDLTILDPGSEFTQKRLHLAENKLQQERLAFQWSVWRDSSKTFWRYAIAGFVTVNVLVALVFGVVTIKTPWFSFQARGCHPIISGYIIATIIFIGTGVTLHFLEMLSHRVQDEFEQHINHDTLKTPFGFSIRLKLMRLIAYFLFPAYTIFMVCVLMLMIYYLYIPLPGGGLAWTPRCLSLK